MTNQSMLALSSGLLGGLLVYKIWKSQSSAKILLPPSPNSYPLIGHLLSIPTKFEHLEFMKLSQQLSTKIFSLSAFGITVVVLDDVQDAIELFEKRSAVYSDRTVPPMLSEPSLLDWEAYGSTMRYGERWKKYRRLMNPWLNKKSVLVDKYHGFESSKDLEDEVYSTIASTLLQSVYGYELKSLNDRFLVDARETMHHGEYAFLTSNFLVNLIPSLVHVPDWFPGTKWKETARQWRHQKERAIQDIYQWTKIQIENGNGGETIVASMTQEAQSLGLSPDQVDDHVQHIAFTLLTAGADTSAAVLMGFFLAIILFPDTRIKAQKEIDAIVGLDRLPTMEDQPQLPYINRMVQEILRWFPVTPIALPHTCYQDDIYKGYNIPKGTIVFGNVWSMTRNPDIYKDPGTFDPDRFLDPSVPSSPLFGWGRRRCPGQHFAEASLFIMIASFLATFDIEMARDNKGQPLVPSTKVTNSVVFYPEPFNFKLKPRSERHKELIRSAS